MTENHASAYCVVWGASPQSPAPRATPWKWSNIYSVRTRCNNTICKWGSWGTTVELSYNRQIGLAHKNCLLTEPGRNRTVLNNNAADTELFEIWSSGKSITDGYQTVNEALHSGSKRQMNCRVTRNNNGLRSGLPWIRLEVRNRKIVLKWEISRSEKEKETKSWRLKEITRST